MSTVRMVSVVVIGRNEGERLRTCLESVRQMSAGEWEAEVIYVDSGSRDGSLELAAAMGSKVVALHPERPTAALGRNAGWRVARGEVVLFLDGDTVLAPDFVLRSLPEFDKPEVAIVWGHRREMFPEQSLYNRVLDLDWVYRPGPAEFCGGDALFRRSALEATKGFDETLIAGEEPELCRRVLAKGGKILHVDRPMTGHDLAMTHFRQYWRRATRAGHAYAEIGQRFAESGQPFWQAEVRRNRRQVLAMATASGLVLLPSALLRIPWPALVFCIFACGLVLRTAWKARWKSRNWMTLLLYGLHSQLQQIPIFIGQMQFRHAQRVGLRRGLVEYKS